MNGKNVFAAVFLSNPHETCMSPHFTTGFPQKLARTALKPPPTKKKIPKKKSQNNSAPEKINPDQT